MNGLKQLVFEDVGKTLVMSEEETVRRKTTASVDSANHHTTSAQVTKPSSGGRNYECCLLGEKAQVV